MTTKHLLVNKLRPYTFTILVTAVIVVLSVISVRSIPKIEVRAGDKIGHFLAYSCLAFTAIFETAKKIRWSNDYRRSLIYILPLCIVFGVGMEFVQASSLFNRHFDYYDMLANTIGVVAGTLLFLALFKRFQRFHIN